MSLPYNGELILRAKDLRKNATRQEKRLWYDFLNRYPIRFQRQKAIRNYIVDFYCHAAKLVIEIDGDQHGEPKSIRYDSKRTADLEQLGLLVLRFTNSDVEHGIDQVCAIIDDMVRGRIKPEDAAKLPDSLPL